MVIKLLKLLKSKFILIFTYIILFSCVIPDKNCSNFKVGEFNFVSETNKTVYNSRSIRNDSIEVEYFGATIDTSKITWVSDCEYILRKLRPKNISEEKAVSVKIISTFENGYVFEYSFVGDIENRARGNAYRVK
tara:strand:+ start:4241 stop:4642 length:402 start_codon:yes stop_codon:yes gene_type:complete